MFSIVMFPQTRFQNILCGGGSLGFKSGDLSIPSSSNLRDVLRIFLEAEAGSGQLGGSRKPWTFEGRSMNTALPKV